MRALLPLLHLKGAWFYIDIYVIKNLVSSFVGVLATGCVCHIVCHDWLFVSASGQDLGE